MLREMQLSDVEFGIGAAAIPEALTDQDDRLNQVGELLMLCGRGFVQAPQDQQVASGRLIASPFYVGWQGVPDFWMRIRTWSPIEFREVMAAVARAFDVPCQTLGIVGAIRMASPSQLKEKRLALSPSDNNAQTWAKSRGDDFLILRDELINEFFQSGVEIAEPFDSTMLITGLMHRSGAPFSDKTMSTEQLNRAFYTSPREQVAGNHWQQHIHLGLSRESGLDSLWNQLPLTRDALIDSVNKLDSEVVLVSHLESVSVAEAFIGVQCIEG